MLRAVLDRYPAAEGLVVREDASLVAAFVQGIERLLVDHGVELTPLVALRAEDVLVSWLVARRIEAELCAQGVFVAAPASRARARCEESAPEPPAQALAPAIEAAGKARERMRKAMKELEESCAKLGAPIDKGLADLMKPILKKAEGVLEDAIAYEEARKKRASAQTKREVRNG